MTILPKKKERNAQKSERNASSSHSEEMQINHSHRHNYSSPPRWGQKNTRPERGTVGESSIGIELTADASKRTSSESDVCGGHSLESGPSHSSKRRQRDQRFGCYSRSKSKTNTSGASCSSSSGGSSSDTDIRSPGTSAEQVGVSGHSDANNADVANCGDTCDENVEGYNSGDEYGSKVNTWTADEWKEMETIFEKQLRKKGLIIKNMGEDGACLFRAVADQVYGDQEMHKIVRNLCMDYMAKNEDYFSQYITEDFKEYLRRKRCEHSHGNHIEIQALSEMFNRPIEVYHYNSDPINIFQGCQQTDNAPIRLSYHRNVHYNSIVDPYNATVGVGLGLPSFKPGSAESNLMEKAIRVSEEQELEKAMLEDKLRATDWEATNEAIEEQVARESYLEWLRENEKRSMKSKKSKLTASATATAAANTPENQQSPSRLSPKASSSGVNDVRSSSSRDFSLVETASFMNQLPPQMLGVTDWETPEEGDIIARVLAQSQQEYLDSLKRSVTSGCSETSNSSESNTVMEFKNENQSQACASNKLT
ncbi:OTU domain-containing protein-like protein [Leptotrombidium deliense]|uniref:ubiquitinyl hydrolase 1 n=1 Tax=Leptotrombidium deliense TaxID=299467 RepID=A0A443SJC7_9ACAR|nr:OTU domain-containing protein-like protein [Leptotrombidium deliense]